VSLLLTLGTIMYFFDLETNTSSPVAGIWPFLVAGVLTAFNLGFLSHLRHIGLARHVERSIGNLRLQIAVDLLLLTVVVHFLGSRDTFVPFLYLFHIVLACIFFPYWQGFLVTFLSFGLYLSCLIVETLGLISSGSALFPAANRQERLADPHSILTVIAILGIWMTVSYLVSHISALIYARDSALAQSNQKLLDTQREKTKHMLRTTHELKAPFAAIHANTQLLLNGYCGALPNEAAAVVKKIAERGHRLSAEIQAMLQLANLSSVSKDSLRWERVDLSEIIQKSIDQLQSQAEERLVRIEANLQPVIIIGVADHYRMLFSNLIANALAYSHKGRAVNISCESASRDFATVIIQDSGIGILPEKLPKIFEEYYRTEEAVSHNKNSSGLGLAIVKNIAQTHKIRIKVESTPGEGTRFTCSIPTPPSDQNVSDSKTNGFIQQATRFFRAT